jgi:hypothetical protein
MTYTFKLSRRIARLRAPLLATIVAGLLGCNSTDAFNPEDSTPPNVTGQGAETVPQLSVSYAGGIPFGIFDMPNESFGTRYNGAMRIIGPSLLLSDLAAIKAAGGRVVINFAGGRSRFLDGSGNFSFSLWKASVDRFKGINFSSYIQDGTIIGHYLMDEPNNPVRWNGKTVPPSMIDAMAQYSKQLWPGMATMIRAYPDYLDNWDGTYHYLDAAWAQYVYRKGPAADFLSQNVSLASKQGLGLIVGLNILKGGVGDAPMTPAQVESWGSTLLNSSYPCAFLSWEYDAGYLSNSGIKSAMDVLRGKAQNRSTRSCRAAAASTTPPPTNPAPTPTGAPLPFGLLQTPTDQYSTRWTGAMDVATPAELVARLSKARSSGMKIVVKLASTGLKNADGTFSLTRWKAQVDAFRSLSLGSYITDKTFYLHDLVDQPHCPSCWGGQAISWATLEEMARYSKSIWPGLATTARVAPSRLAEATFRWTYLDAGWAEYNTKMGDLKTFLSAQAAQAKLEGLGLVAGLNLLDGSGYGTSPMSPTQIKTFGSILAGNASVCALVGRSYNASYLSQTGVRDALDAVTTVAKSRSAASCVVN